MCFPKEEAKSLVERLVESMDRLTQAVHQIERRLAPPFDQGVFMRPPYPPPVTVRLDERAGSEGKEWSSGIATTAEVKAALGNDHL